MLVQCAWAAKRKKGSYYQAQFFRLQSRRGPQKAICAVAASLLTAIYHMVKNGTLHRDLGAAHFDRRSSEAQAHRLLAQLAKARLPGPAATRGRLRCHTIHLVSC
jgi:transposase